MAREKPFDETTPIPIVDDGEMTPHDGVRALEVPMQLSLRRWMREVLECPADRSEKSPQVTKEL